MLRTIFSRGTSTHVWTHVPKRLVSQFLTLLTGRVGSALVQAASIYFLAKWTTVSEFGVIASALGIATFSQAFGDLGTSTFAVRETARNGITRGSTHAARLSLVGSLCVACLGGIVLVILCMTDRNFAYLAPLLPWVLVERAAEFRASVARGEGDVWKGTTCLVLRRVGQLCLFAVLFRFGVTVSWSFSLGLLGGSAIVLVAMWRTFPELPDANWSIAELWVTARKCFPYWVHSTATQLKNFDALIVAAVAGSAQAGLYGIGSRLMTPLRMIPSSLATALLPHVSGGGGQLKRHATAGWLLAIALASIYLAIALAVPFAGSELLDGKYERAIVPIQILCIALAVSSASSIFTVILQGSDREGVSGVLSLASLAVFLPAILIGAYIGGAIGAAIGFAGAAIFHMATILVVVHKNA